MGVSRFAHPVFVVAMDNETAAVARALEGEVVERRRFARRVTEGTFRGVPVKIVTSGVGKSNAAAATQLALSMDADVIVNAGVAGGLLPGMKIGGVHRVSAAVQYDFDLSVINGTKIGTLNECSEREFRLLDFGRMPAAVLGTGDRFNDSEADYRFLVDDVKASLRDMEGAAVAHVSIHAGVPCAAYKAVSDVHDSDGIPTAEQYLASLKTALEALSDATPQALADILFQ